MTPEQRIEFEKDVLEQMGYQDEAERVAGQPDVMSAMVKPYNQIKKPSHYDIVDTTVEEMIEELFTHDELMGWFKGNIMKYRLRAFRKSNNGIIDIEKADEYQKFYNQYKERNSGANKRN